MVLPASQFEDSLSVHKGWKDLIGIKQKKYGLSLDKVRQNSLGRIHLHDLREQLLLICRHTNGPTLPIECGRNVTPLTFGCYTLTLWTAPTLDVALKHAEEFFIVVGSPIRLKYNKDRQGNAELWFLDSEPLNSACHVTYLGVMLLFSTKLKIIQSILEQQDLGIEIKLTESKLDRRIHQEIEALTKTRLTLGEPVRKICLSKKYLHLNNPGHDKEIYFASLNLLRAEAENLRKSDIVLRIYNTLNKLDHLSRASAQEVASQLQMNVRTLNRKLANLNTTYRAVLEKYKFEKALHLLEQSNASMTELAYDLGFSDLSTFSRAFKRWTGLNPTKYRAEKLKY